METTVGKGKMQWQRKEIVEQVADVLAAVLSIDASTIDCERSLRIDLGAKSTQFLTISCRIEELFSVRASEELFFHSAVNRAAQDHSIYVDNAGALTRIGAKALIQHAPWMQGKWDDDIVHAGVPIDRLMTVGYIVHYLEWKWDMAS